MHHKAVIVILFLLLSFFEIIFTYFQSLDIILSISFVPNYTEVKNIFL